MAAKGKGSASKIPPGLGKGGGTTAKKSTSGKFASKGVSPSAKATKKTTAKGGFPGMAKKKSR